jgi:hypothetical protein
VKFVKLKQSKKNIILASLFLGLAVLTKSGLVILFYPISGFLLAFLLFIKKKSFIKSFYYVGLFVVIQLVFIMGWQVRNYQATGVMDYSSQVGEMLLFKKHIPFIIAYQEGISNQEARERVRKKYDTEDIMKLDAAARSEYFKKVAFSIVLRSPLDYAIVIAKTSPQLFLGTTPPDFLYTKQKREDFFEILQVELYDYNLPKAKSSLPMLTKRVPAYMGPFSSSPLLKKLWDSNHYSYIFLWSIIKAHVLLIYLMTIIGCFLILRDKSDRWVLVLMVLIIIFYVPVLGPETASRHRAVLMSIFYFLSSYGLIWLGKVFLQFINSRANHNKPEYLNNDNVL